VVRRRRHNQAGRDHEQSGDAVVSETPGSGVRIRDVQPGDLEDFFEQQLDPEATRMAAFPARDRDAFMAHWTRIQADDRNIRQTVVLDGQVAGNVLSWEQDGERMVGYWLGRAYWGRGVATRALALLLDQVPVRPLHADVAVHNVGSIRVLEKCGFRPIMGPDGPQVTVGEDGIGEMSFVLEK
jgi:RimJ/RimL family protein N-acetyltransferase